MILRTPSKKDWLVCWSLVYENIPSFNNMLVKEYFGHINASSFGHLLHRYICDIRDIFQLSGAGVLHTLKHVCLKVFFSQNLPQP